MTFLLNTWYMAGWADELSPAGTLARTVAGLPVLIARDGAGALFAVADRCPHRMAPLSLGQVADGVVTCGYHGLAFDRHGTCVLNPHGRATRSLDIRSFPVAERHGAVWLWPGDPAAADAGLIPDLGFVDAAAPHGHTKGYMHTRAAHQLLSDNILDLSHADYLHPSTLGGGSISRATPKVEPLPGERLRVSWTALDETPLPVLRGILRGDRADMWTTVEWHPDGVMVLTVEATPAGYPREESTRTVNAHVMTPETATTTHYFYFNSRNFRTDDPAYNQQRGAALRRAFEQEDKLMVEAQQRAIGDVELMTLKPALLRIDAGSVASRRIYGRLLAAEAA